MRSLSTWRGPGRLAGIAIFSTTLAAAAPGFGPSAPALEMAAVQAVPEDEPVRVERRCNTTIRSRQGSAVVAVAGSGHAAVGWVSRRHHRGRDAVCLQCYDATGGRQDGEVLAWPSAQQQQSAPTLAFVGETLWLGWSAFDQAVGTRAFVRPHLPGAAPVAIGGVGARDLVLTAVGTALLAVWVEGEGLDTRVWARRLDVDGTPSRGGPLSTGGQAAALPVVAALNDGRAVVVWAAAGREPGLWARFVTADGRATGAAFALPGADRNGDVEPSVAARRGGEFAVTWMRRNRDTDGYQVWAAVYDAEQPNLGTPTPRRVAEGGSLSGAIIAATPDGVSWCVAWNEERHRAHGRDVDVRALWLTGAGVPIGKPFEVTSSTTSLQRLSAATNRRALACPDPSTLLVAWEGDAGLGDPHGVHLTRRRVPRDAGVSPRPAPLPTGPQPTGPLPTGPLPTGPLSTAPLPTGPDGNIPVAPKPIFVGAAAQARGAAVARRGGGFEAITNTGWVPPDPHVAVGPDHLVCLVNGGIAFFAKDGTRTFFQNISGSGGFLGGGGTVFDPRVVFDPHSGRFMVSAAEHVGTRRGYLVLGVSDDDDPNGTWHRYRFDVTAQIGTYFIDFPHLGVDERAVYVGADPFGGYFGHVLYVIDKQPLLTGGPVVPVLVQNDFLTSAGIGTQIGTSAATYLVTLEAFTATLRVWALTDPLTNPTLVNVPLSIPPLSAPGGAPQQGSSVLLNPLDWRVATTSFIDGRLYCAHSADNPPVARWYEVEIGDWPRSGPAPRLAQTGIVPGQGEATIFPSIAADAYGNVLLCATLSSPTDFPSVAYYTRTAADPPGTMRGPVLAQASAVPYTRGTWGHYSAVSLDPRDRATFWCVQEWARGRRSWSTWIEGHRLQPPTLQASAATLSASTGGAVTLQLDNPPFAGRTYVMLAGASGTAPGFRLPGPPAIVNMDLNIDGVTAAMIPWINTPAFERFAGTLDAGGQATATLRLPPLPALAGQSLWFAYAQDGSPWEFASNSVQVSLVP
ncbi:MAG: hypothetical protein AAF628_10610 [Planctomycetota bacterium]